MKKLRWKHVPYMIESQSFFNYTNLECLMLFPKSNHLKIIIYKLQYNWLHFHLRNGMTLPGRCNSTLYLLGFLLHVKVTRMSGPPSIYLYLQRKCNELRRFLDVRGRDPSVQPPMTSLGFEVCFIDSSKRPLISWASIGYFSNGSLNISLVLLLASCQEE